jgi:ribosome recycling factor
MSSEIITQYQPRFQKLLDHLLDDLKSLRTGRATPALVEDIKIEAYGALTPLVGLASITCPDSKSVVIEPWDKGLVKEIEKGLQEAKLGINPTVAGTVIRLNMPPMTEESRRDLTKVLHDKLEHSRISVRNIRDEIKGEILGAEKDNSITEDDRYRLLEQMDKNVGEWNDKIKEIGEAKEKEIMTI